MRLCSLLVMFFLQTFVLHAQSEKPFDSFFSVAETRLQNGDTVSARALYLQSIQEFENPESYYRLALLAQAEGTIDGRQNARVFFRKAISKDPANTIYRLALGALLEDTAFITAFGEYEEILDEIDSTCAEAWFRMGRMRARTYDDYRNSFRNTGQGILISLGGFSQEDFSEAEYYFTQAVKFDSTRIDYLFEIALLYEDAGKYEAALPFLEKACHLEPDLPKAFLFLGLLHFRLNDHQNAFLSYRTAFLKMHPEERSQYTEESVYALVEPLFGNLQVNYEPEEVHFLIERFWKARDPLHLTQYNERLLEHYTRVVYAELRFRTKGSTQPGWKTDRGEVLLRYGLPDEVRRLRPQFSGDDLLVKTDIWDYPMMKVGFVDESFSGTFRFSRNSMGGKIRSQFDYDSKEFINTIKKKAPEYYEPHFAGEVFTVPFTTAQFRSLDSDTTELVVTYSLPFPPKMAQYIDSADIDHNVGFFLFDEIFNTIASSRRNFQNSGNTPYFYETLAESCYVSAITVPVPADSGFASFEIIRETNNGVFSRQFPITVEQFPTGRFSLSDLITARKIEEIDDSGTVLNQILFPLRRKNISILPQPDGTFTSGQEFFLYYEIYNLQPDSTGTRRYKQFVTLERKSDTEETSLIEDIFEGALNVFGIDKKGSAITISSEYETTQTIEQNYFLLDVSAYEPDEYLITVHITDIVSGETAFRKIIFRIKE